MSHKEEFSIQTAFDNHNKTEIPPVHGHLQKMSGFIDNGIVTVDCKGTVFGQQNKCSFHKNYYVTCPNHPEIIQSIQNTFKHPDILQI